MQQPSCDRLKGHPREDASGATSGVFGSGSRGLGLGSVKDNGPGGKNLAAKIYIDVFQS
jgi:hypothetical protein